MTEEEFRKEVFGLCGFGTIEKVWDMYRKLQDENERLKDENKKLEDDWQKSYAEECITRHKNHTLEDNIEQLQKENEKLRCLILLFRREMYRFKCAFYSIFMKFDKALPCEMKFRTICKAHRNAKSNLTKCKVRIK